MKKNIKKSLIISGTITVIWIIINFICANTIHKLPLSLTIHGGEYEEIKGLGVVLEKIYTLGPIGSDGVKTNIRLDIISLIILFIVIFAIVLLINNIINKKKNK